MKQPLILFTPSLLHKSQNLLLFHLCFVYLVQHLHSASIFASSLTCFISEYIIYLSEWPHLLTSYKYDGVESSISFLLKSIFNIRIVHCQKCPEEFLRQQRAGTIHYLCSTLGTDSQSLQRVHWTFSFCSTSLQPQMK